MTLISDSFIFQAEKSGACKEALTWLREKPRTVEELVEHHPDGALWACQLPDWVNLLGPKRLEECLERKPGAALRYATSHITPTRLDWCAAQEPWAALFYVAFQLTPERLDWCAAQEPWAALRGATSRLTPERRDWCAERGPRMTLRYATSRLTPERFDWCKTVTS